MEGTLLKLTSLIYEKSNCPKIRAKGREASFSPKRENKILCCEYTTKS